jgi:hypothetical protein
MSTAPLDYDGLMQANLGRVFSERDASRRLKSMAQFLCAGPDIVRAGHRGEESRRDQPSGDRIIVEPAAELRFRSDRPCRWPPSSAHRGTEAARTMSVRSLDCYTGNRVNA